MPYQPKVPASSNCVTYTSSAIYATLPTNSGVTPPSSGTGTRTSTGTGPSNTSGGNNGSATGIKVESAVLSMGVGAVGIVFAVLALA